MDLSSYLCAANDSFTPKQTLLSFHWRWRISLLGWPWSHPCFSVSSLMAADGLTSGCLGQKCWGGRSATLHFDELVQFGAGSLYSSCDAFSLRYLTFMTRRRVTAMICLYWVIPVCFEVLLVTSLYLRLVTLSQYFQLAVCDIAWATSLLNACIFFVATMVRVAYKHDRAACILSKQLRFNHHVLLRSHDKTEIRLL